MSHLLFFCPFPATVCVCLFVPYAPQVFIFLFLSTVKLPTTNNRRHPILLLFSLFHVPKDIFCLYRFSLSLLFLCFVYCRIFCAVFVVRVLSSDPCFPIILSSKGSCSSCCCLASPNPIHRLSNPKISVVVVVIVIPVQFPCLLSFFLSSIFPLTLKASKAT